MRFLLGLQLADGSFEWQPNTGSNLMATAQAVPAVLGQPYPVTVRDLDEDYSIGKLPEEQYRAERAIWSERGAAILEMLEQYADVGHQPRVRGAAAKVPANPADDPIESAIAAYIKAREQAQQPQLEQAQ